jgi:U3 small nucleolar RNA-associated protein 19
MPAMFDNSVTSKKRKGSKESGVPSSKRRAVAENASAESMAKIQQLEEQISESRKNYNNIATLLSMLSEDGTRVKPNLAVAVSLCRVFSRLIAGGNLTVGERAPENEKIVVAWLKERCREYQRLLESFMRESDASSQVSCAFCKVRQTQS